MLAEFKPTVKWISQHSELHDKYYCITNKKPVKHMKYTLQDNDLKVAFQKIRTQMALW